MPTEAQKSPQLLSAAKSLGKAGTNVVSNLTKEGKDVRVEIVKPFTMAADAADKANSVFGANANGKTITVNGNNNLVTSMIGNGHRSTRWDGTAEGKVIINNFNLINDQGSSIMQYYGGITVDIVDSKLISTKHRGVYFTGAGTRNLKGNT